MSDLAKRAPTTVVLLAFAFATIRFLPPLPFALALYGVISLAVLEFLRLAKPRRGGPLLALGNGLLVGTAFAFPAVPLPWVLAAAVILTGLYFLFAIRDAALLPDFVRDFGIQLLAVLYLYFPLFYLLELKKLGHDFLFFFIALIAIGDSGAYFVGRAIGRHKIYPVASPKKSLEGLLAAIATAALSGYLLLFLFPITPKKWLAVGTAAAIELVSQLSDPVESLFKRAAGQKDSGALLPGHGGALDRLDSYIFCAPLFTFIVVYFWK